MERTVISLDSEDRLWLDAEARNRHVSMTELVRQAVHAYRLRAESSADQTRQLMIRETAGIWRRADGLAQQTALRDEWNGRE